MDENSELIRDKYFLSKHCAYCGSDEKLELDRVNPLEFQTDDLWGWTELARRKELLECQVLCGPCYRRKKSMWKKFRIANEDWYQKFKGQKFDKDYI